jgi:hypothetical protein
MGRRRGRERRRTLGGSKIADGKDGAGVLIERREGMNMTVHLRNYVEVYDAELTVIRKAAEYYKEWSDENPH